MDTAFHPLTDLFKQLGLPSDCNSISQFISTHAPLDPGMVLADAPFWSDTQREFLSDELLKDADWAESIDLLNGQLRELH